MVNMVKHYNIPNNIGITILAILDLDGQQYCWSNWTVNGWLMNGWLIWKTLNVVNDFGELFVNCPHIFQW